jgi:hypothetical protein
MWRCACARLLTHARSYVLVCCVCVCAEYVRVVCARKERATN